MVPKRSPADAVVMENCCAPEETKVGSAFRFKEEPSSCFNGGIEKASTRIYECMSLSRSTISHHFKELQNAGLITCERDGETYICRVNEETVGAIKNFLK